jgi:geranylgeranyl pyrophosphate synthase
MVAGQMTELLASAADLKTIEVVHDRKTSSLFVASGQVPAILAGAAEQDMHAVGFYAHHLGLAYQIADDISDAPAPGLNVAALLGVDEAAKKAHEHIQAAIAFLEEYGESACPLRQLAAYVLSRIE